MDQIHQLHAQGQSIWYDNIQRRLLENGELAELIGKGEIRGVTSNPSIFHNAISQSTDYDSALKSMAWSGWDAEQIFWQLAVEDICSAADLFLPLYEQTKGADGFVSLEVDPRLAHDTTRTHLEALRLWKLVNRPNLMIKIPATREGIPAIRQTIAAGLNVNVTLIFSLGRYHQVINAYLEGLEERLSKGQPLSGIASVASFFVSRLDTKVDNWLNEKIKKGSDEGKIAQNLLGKTAIANTRQAYRIFQEIFKSERFQRLHEYGASIQRPLWASTSTKNPAYKDTMYVDELIAPDSVNTTPPQTLDAFRDHGQVNVKIEKTTIEDQRVLQVLEKLGLSLEKATQELEIEGVIAFENAFSSLLKTIVERCTVAQSELGALKTVIPARVKALESINALERIYEIDPSLWVDDPSGQEEIRKRLGWLESPYKSQDMLTELIFFARECKISGYTHALLLGMGGSSLAPEVMSLILNQAKRNGDHGLNLTILDSTHPDQVRALAALSPIEKTLYIVSSKSGTTSEVNALVNYFWKRSQHHLGKKTGDHFIAITDAGSTLDKLAQERGFRRIFYADPNVGGRYSALTAYGLVPAALMGLDVVRLLIRAQWMVNQCKSSIPYGRNPGLVLGAIIGEATVQGRDKLVLFSDPSFRPFGSWLEQLIAESSGKQGKGIIPVDGDILHVPDDDLNDRLYIYLRQQGEMANQAKKLRKEGCPVLEIQIPDLHYLGALFYQWEIAISIACTILRVNPFDQPDVQDNKIRTAEMVKSFLKNGVIVEGDPIWEKNQIKVFGDDFPDLKNADNLSEVVMQFLKLVHKGDYVAINAYLPRNRNTITLLQKLRRTIRQQAKCVVTIGFGPRFLHSSGQLHKGGTNNGIFLEITDDPQIDLSIPEQGMTFGKLIRAQAQGDLEALQARKRRIICIHLSNNKLINLI